MDTFAAGVHCPHCGSLRLQRWGRRAGRQRHRCVACCRTFNDFTDTALAHCKRIDRWPRYGAALLAGLSVRAAARTCGVSVSTAFRWRHLVLQELRRNAMPVPRGAAEATEVRFLYSEKGSRGLCGEANRRGARNDSLVRPRYWALLVRDADGATVGRAIGRRPPLVHQLEDLLVPPAGDVAELAFPAGPASTYAAFCRIHRIRPRYNGLLARRYGGTPAANVSPARACGARLRGWMKRFNGVASKYLDNYLRWHALVDASPRATPDLVLAAAFTSPSSTNPLREQSATLSRPDNRAAPPSPTRATLTRAAALREHGRAPPSLSVMRPP